MRSLADQEVAELGGRLSVLIRQKVDHVELDRLLHELADTGPAQQDPVLRRIYRLVFPHPSPRIRCCGRCFTGCSPMVRS